MPESLESETLRLIVESLPTGTIIVSSFGAIVMLNRTVEAWFGYRREEILGKNCECLIPNRFLPNHSRYQEEYFASPHIRPMGANKALFAKRKDGTEFPCDISLHPIQLATGMHVMLHMVDATGRKQAEARQRHNESLLRMQFMVENLPAGAIYVSLETQSVMVNRAFVEITGYQQSELGNLTAAIELLFRDQALQVRTIHDKDQAAGFPVSRVLPFYRKNGNRGWVEIAAYRYSHNEVWLWHDVTERMAIQEKLVQSERLAAIGEMMAGLAHESRNALQRARSALEMLELDLSERPDLLTFSHRATTAVDELQRLYEEVRNYAAPILLELQSVELEELWHEVWSQVLQVHRKRRPTLRTFCSAATRVVTIDRYRVRQVFRNILENAVAVLPESDGIISISADVVEIDGRSWTEVSIQDNGPGMTAEQQIRVFDPFYTTKTRGTGLGMAIVRRIMEAHGGTASVAPCDSGACIVLRFPRT